MKGAIMLITKMHNGALTRRRSDDTVPAILQLRSQHSGLNHRKILVACPPISCVDRCSVLAGVTQFLIIAATDLCNRITDPVGHFADAVVSR